MSFDVNGVVHRDYPLSPPACLQCAIPGRPTAEGGFVAKPSNETCVELFGPNGCVPSVNGPSSTFWVVIYVMLVVTAVSCASWAVVRSRASRELGVRPSLHGGGGGDDLEDGETGDKKSEPESRGPGLGDDDDGDDEKTPLRGRSSATHTPSLAGDGRIDRGDDERPLVLTYYRSSHAETCFLALVGLNLLVLLADYLVLCIDFYLECENTGSPDNLCYFGTFRIFGDYQRNSEAFFAVWILMSLYSLAVCSFWRELRDWVRRPSSAADADVVAVWVREEVHLLASGPPSTAARLRRWAEAKHRRCSRQCWTALCGARRGRALASGTWGRSTTVPIETNALGERYFRFQCVRYLVRDETRVNSRLPASTTPRDLLATKANPPNAEIRWERLQRGGPNEIHLVLPSVGRMLVEEFFTPFYCYQFSIYLMWIWWTYWFVGALLLLVVVASGAWTVALKRQNLIAVHNLARHRDPTDVYVREESAFVTSRDSRDLVPGDLIRVAGLATVPADAVLVQGSCAADEADLTGESMPQPKTSIQGSGLSLDQPLSVRTARAKPHALFAGTRILESSPDAYAVIVATGVDATRGLLLSHVLFPATTMFRFDEDFIVAVFLLLCYALVVFIAATALQNKNGADSSWTTILAYCVFSVSQVVSPMLKIALVAGRVAASRRLQTKGISVIDPQRIDVAGKVRVFCFDKTGTLTKEGLTLIQIKPLVQAGQDADELMRMAAATAHSLGTFHGRLLGSSLERSMFEASGWTLASSDEACSPGGELRLYVRRRFPFDQTRRTMSAAVQDHSGATTRLFVKGAPESVAKLCSSGVPPDFLSECEAIAGTGCYVLAVAWRPLARVAPEDERDELERDLRLLGYLVFRNEVKDDAAASVAELKRGHVRVVMITGDNAPCATHVARETGIAEPGRDVMFGEMRGEGGASFVQWRAVGALDPSLREARFDSVVQLLRFDRIDQVELGLTGEAFEHLALAGQLSDVLHRTRVVARANPAQKVRVVTALMEGPDGLITAMAGDGGNDSGALRAAHVGLSVGGTESSVVAPFSCKLGDVDSAVRLLAEGRCSLATSLSSYKLIVTYGLLFSIVKMASFYFAVLMPMLGYVFIDIVAVVPLTFAVTLAQPLPRLGPTRPTSSLLGPVTVGSLLGVYVVSLSSMAVNLALMTADAGYVQWPARFADTAAWWLISDNWEASVIWSSTFYVFITSAVAFSFGSAHRASLFSNWVLLVVWAVLYSFCSYLVLAAPSYLTLQFHMASEQFNRPVDPYNPVWQKYQAAGGRPSPAMSASLRWALWGFSQIAMILLVLWERLFIFGPGGEVVRKWWTGRRRAAESAADTDNLGDDERAVKFEF